LLCVGGSRLAVWPHDGPLKRANSLQKSGTTIHLELHLKPQP
jgi:hypothetical protein